jgi:hypothetical protein
MINYILQIILFQVLFLAIYDFFLSKETFFTKNRWYLISTPVLSFILPFIKIPTFQKAVPQEFIIYLPEIVLSPEKVIQEVIQETSLYQSINYLDILFWLGVSLFSMLFLVKLYKITNLIKKHEVVKKADYTLVLIPNQTKAFSFFNFIFLGKEIPISQQAQIIEHELVHSKQKHTLDLLLFEFLKIMMWFNPMIFLFQKRITLVHEYISDEVAAKSETKEIYINNLLSNFFQVENIAFVNQFYKQTFIKKRIIMMKKTQSKKMNQLKYLVLIPVLASMLFYTSCASKDKDKESEIELLRLQNQQLRDSLSVKNRQLEITSTLAKFIAKKGKNISSDGTISFTVVDKSPTFPGCESGDKDCFSKEIKKHFSRNFDSKLPNRLGLKSGKKRVFIAFDIDKEGNIVNVQARAPHKDIKEEVIRVMNTLPIMIPGEHNGKTIAVKYSIPVTIVID